MRHLYSLLHYLLLPAALARLVWRSLHHRGYRQRWGERLGLTPRVPAGAQGTFWIHAVSVGEVQAAVPLVRAVQARSPGLAVLVTTTTPTGADRVVAVFGEEVHHRYMPYDLPGAVRRFLDRVRPVVAVIMETELWPNLLHQCRQRNIPVVLANLRLSERSAAGYRRVPTLTRSMLSGVAAVAAQSPADAERLVQLGADPSRVTVTGSIKFDVRLPASLSEEAQVLRRCFGVDRGVWIAASTHEGEDEQVLEAFARVLREVPDCLLVLVPRHPERFSGAAALCRKRGYSTVSRSDEPDSCEGVDVFIGNTMGELPLFYAASDVAFVGGSLVAIGGHNLLEPAALGIPVITGPHLFNFAEIARRLRDVGAALEVDGARTLGDAVIRYLQDANLRHNTGERGRRFVEENRGAQDRVMALLEAYLP